MTNCGSSTITITPTMFMGRPEAAEIWLDMIPVDNASDALTVVMCGHKALLPPGAWDVAADVLRRFGATEEWIHFILDRCGRGRSSSSRCEFPTQAFPDPNCRG